MEADWAVESAGDDPVIVVPWKAPEPAGGSSSRRFIDLRQNPLAISEIAEAQVAAGLRTALIKLNDASSRIWTAKCDLWQAAADGTDPLEMEAAAEEANFLCGSYIDVLQRESDVAQSFEAQERWIRSLAAQLRRSTLHCARADFVLRRAQLWGRAGFGVTWYASGCGITPESAYARWEKALARSLPVVQEMEA